MKKTFLLSLLLAGVASAETIYTLDSSIIKTEDNSKVSAWDAVIGKTPAEASNVEGIKTGDKGLHFSSKEFTIDLSEMYSLTDMTDKTLQLTSFSFLSRGAADYTNYGTLTITINGKSISSNTVTIGTDTATTTYRPITYTFTDELLFTANDSITVSISKGSGTNDFGMGALTSADGYSFGGAPELLSNNNGSWRDFYRIEAKLIPEPATATLSLLALAGMAIRRRRK